MDILVVDTNFFMQCKDPKNLNFNEIISDNQCKMIKIIIPQSVEMEIDKFKSDGNTRRAKKARKTNTFIRDIISKGDSSKIIQGDLTITFGFSDFFKKSELESVSDILDIVRPDHSIIAEALLLQKRNKDDNYFLLTNDTIPIRLAKRLDLAHIIIPDSWLLPPENDKNEKAIVKLKEEINSLKCNTPKIDTKSVISGQKYSPSMTVSIINCNKLSTELKGTIKDHFISKYPLDDILQESNELIELSNLHLSLGFKYEFPTKEQIKIYRNKSYPNWLNEIIKEFEDYISNRNSISHHINCNINVSNTGNIPIEHTIVEIKSYSGILIAPPDYEKNLLDLNKNFSLPELPQPPRKILRNPFKSNLDMISNHMLERPEFIMPNFNTTKSRDRNAFYWKNKPFDYSTTWTFECDEFLHKFDSECFDFNLFIPDNFSDKFVSFSIFVHGNNLESPYKKFFKFKIEFDSFNIEAEITLCVKMTLDNLLH
jgi:hypothetical protein